MMAIASGRLLGSSEPSPSSDQGWALLGLLLTLGVISIVLVSSVVPNVQVAVQRDKEAEMIYRGEQMALGIARYYGRGNLAPLQLLVAPTPLPYLTELAKLRDGVNIGVRELKFVRPSALIDPMTSSDWEPVRARDPRIMPFLQAWTAETQIPIPQQYLWIAAPPLRSVFRESDPSSTPPAGEGQGRPTPPNPINPGNPQIKPPGQPQGGEVDPDDSDDDDDDDDDPLAHLFETDSPGRSNAPIVGVAPKRKGKALRSYFGLDRYDDWIFIYIPKIVPGARQGNPADRRPPVLN